jgi:Ankyrin repeats (many copies)
MAKAKKKLLPKDFEALLAKGELGTLKAVFDTCDVNARGGAFKKSALAFNDCPDDLARWLVEKGADVLAGDKYGETPLHSRAGHWQGRLDILFELKADLNHGANKRGTPLHNAAGAFNAKTAALLVQNGAHVNALNDRKQTPLAYALQRCRGASIEEIAAVAEMLLQAGAFRTPEMQDDVTRIGTEFEFQRDNFNPDEVDATSTALDKLYVLFEVTPAPRRALHDGKSLIVAKAKKLQDRNQELWELLVPSSGAAATVQGEVIRIAGRIQDELERNGGVNWDADYKKMADAFLANVSLGVPLSNAELSEVKNIVAQVKGRRGDTARMAELAVQWVALNPAPIALAAPNYKR